MMNVFMSLAVLPLAEVGTLTRNMRAAVEKNFSASSVVRAIDSLPVVRRQTDYAIGRTPRVQQADRGAGRWRAARAMEEPATFNRCFHRLIGNDVERLSRGGRAI